MARRTAEPRAFRSSWTAPTDTERRRTMRAEGPTLAERRAQERTASLQIVARPSAAGEAPTSPVTATAPTVQQVAEIVHGQPPAVPAASAQEHLSRAIDLLAAAGRTAPTDRAANAALWRAVFSLPAWSFIACAGLQAPQPFVCSSRYGAPVLLAFTSPQRAVEAGRARGVVDHVGQAQAFHAPPASVVAAAEQYRAFGVAGVLFDEGHSAFFAPFEQLAPLHRELVGA
jgi:hypothetical protein